ncbi:hypothetical protein BHE74_00026952 [Ensete ventricosum]|nr:hypothetical protein BHE74_00026952 [Ensete ventricosum]
MGKVYTLAEVLTHNSSKDCWLIINGKVHLYLATSLSVTQFMLEICHFFSGKDAGDDFEDIGHSTTARAMMDEYCVGEIDAATIPKRVTYTPPKQPHYSQDKMAEFIIRLLQFLVPLAILGLAVAVRFCTKSS